MTAQNTAAHLLPGMMIRLDQDVYRVESSVRVAIAKGVAVMKTRLLHMTTEESLERNFKMDEVIEEVKLSERKFEYLYFDQGKHLFLDVVDLNVVAVSPEVIGENVNYLKEGVHVVAKLYGDHVYSIELPQFLELMVARVEEGQVTASASITHNENIAVLETGAKIAIPSYVDSGDHIKVDTTKNEFIQRV